MDKKWKFKITAYIHPQTGDDYKMAFLVNRKPTQAEITAKLKSLGSVVYNDYVIEGLQ